MYRNLSLNRDNIPQAIDFFCRCNYKEFTVSEEDREKFKRFNIAFDGNTMFLDVFFNKRGGTTLQVTNGNHIEEKKKLAAYIAESDLCKIGESNILNRTIVFKHISADDFDAIMRLLPEDEYYSATISRHDSDNNIIIKLSGRMSDTATVTYFKTTHTVMLQGRPLLLFSEISSLFHELMPSEDIITSLANTYSVDMSTESIEEQYIALLPKSHSKHSDKLKKSLLKAVYNLNVPEAKYTCTELTFEVLRALEGHIKLTLSSHFSISSPHPNGLLSMFSYNEDTDTVSISASYESKISDPQKIEYYKETYKFYKLFRHKIFHWDFPSDPLLDTTEQIDDIEEAKNIIRETLKVIDNFY